MVKACLTERFIDLSGTKVGHSDPIVLCGKAIAHVVRQFGPYLPWV